MEDQRAKDFFGDWVTIDPVLLKEDTKDPYIRGVADGIKGCILKNIANFGYTNIKILDEQVIARPANDFGDATSLPTVAWKGHIEYEFDKKMKV